MKPSSFDYVAPGTLGEAVSVLEQHEGEAKLLAGGQSLIPLLNMRLARPEVLVDLRRLADLDSLAGVTNFKGSRINLIHKGRFDSSGSNLSSR